MNVLHVVPSLSVRTGGPAFNVAALASGSVAMGANATIFATDMARAGSARSGASVTAGDLPFIDERVRVSLFRSRPPHRFAFTKGLARTLQREMESFDLVHIHSLYLYPQAIAAHLAHARRVPYIISPRGSLDPWVRQQGRLQKSIAEHMWLTRHLEHAEAIHVTGTGEAAYIADVAPRVPRIVIPNGIYADEFAPGCTMDVGSLRQDLGITKDECLIAYIGRLSHKKNLPFLIEAFARAYAAQRNARLLIAGPDDESIRPILATQIRKRGIQNSVSLLGEVRGGTRRAALAAADVFVLPSHTENFGTAAIEALASGCAVILSEGVAIARELGGGGAAMVVEPTVAGLAEGMRRLAGDAEAREGLRAAGIEIARSYDWKELVSKYLLAYDGVLRRSSPANLGVR